MANIIKRVWNQNRMVQIEDLKGMTFQAEQAGHTFQISGIDDEGNTVALTGTPAGVLLRPDNTDVALTCSVSGGVVSATLPANCYDVPGRFGLTIFITSGSSKTAIYAAVGTVTRTSSGTVAPGTSQSVVDLINAINTAVNSIPASYSALLADIAPTYSNSALYSVGQYAWYDGDLKRCIVPITTAESYTAAHWTSAVLGQDVSDLKSALLLDVVASKVPELSNNTDLNSVTTPGSYRVLTSSAAASMSHTPVTNSGFRLIVTTTTLAARLAQIILCNKNDPEIYTRFRNNDSTWGDWKRIALTSEIESAVATINGLLNDNKNFEPDVVKDIIEYGYAPINGYFERGGVNMATGGWNDTDTAKYRTGRKISFGSLTSVKIVPLKPSILRVSYCYFNAQGTYVGYQSGIDLANGAVTITNSYPYYLIQFSHSDGTTVTDAEMEDIVIGYDFNVDSMKAYSAMADYFNTVDLGDENTGLLSGSVGSEISINSSLTNYHYKIATVSAGDKIHIAANTNGQGQRPYFITNSSNEIVERGIQGIDAVPFLFEDDIVIPSGASKLYINYYGDTDCYAFKYSIIPDGFFDIPYDTQFTAKNGLATSISSWTPTVTESNAYSYALVRTKPGSKYLIDGYYSGSGNRFIYEISNSGGYLRALVTGTDGVTKHYNGIIELSSDAYGIVVCWKNDHDIIIQPMNPYHIAEKISQIETEVSSIKEESEKPYAGKRIVFFGTSIPAGSVTIDGVSYSIPSYIGKLLGATVFNEAVGESCARRGWKTEETADDPYGWTAHSWRNVFWAMGANLTEKQDLIDNYASKWYDLLRDAEDKPATIDSATQNKILACSYENKLIPYLDGTKSMPDLFVFEHGHNDVDYIDPTEISGVASVNPNDISNFDRSLFGDVMAFYIRLIKQYNPQAKILIVSNYENDSDYYKNVFTAQKNVAETNKVWFCDVANRIGWSAVKKLTTTGYWSNGYWVESGGNSQTITFLQAAFPDQIHPHTDKSGKAIIREATVIASFIKSAGILDIQ